MVKRIRYDSGMNNRVIFGNNCLNLYIFLAVSKLNLWRNIASNTACRNRAKRSRYFNRVVTYNQKNCCDCSIKVSWSHACSMLASGRRPFIRLIPSCYVLQWWNSHKLLLLQWTLTTTKSILSVQSSSAAVQRVFSLVNSGFTYHADHYKTIIYGED